MSADDDRDAAAELVRLLRGILEDEAIARLEATLATAALPDSVPMPDTAHPAYESKAAAVRDLMDGRNAIRVARGIPAIAATADKYPQTVELRTNMLEVRRCSGPAPFVGDPRFKRAAYFWQVAIDDAGRWVAGPAELSWGHP